MSAEPPYIRIYLKAVARVAMLALLLFLPAQTLRWPAGWLYLALYAAWSGINIRLLRLRSPQLLAQREAHPPAASEAWDKAFVSTGAALLGLLLIICAMEGPAAGFSAVSAGAFLAIGAGYALFTQALLSNPFAIGVAAIQRGQAAVDTGPYRAVRHPLYLAAVVIFLCTPAALGSPGAFLPAGLLAAAVIARTALEDRLLLRSLPGYKEYAQRVPYRLLPGFW